MPLRGFTDGADEVVVTASTVRDALAALEETHRGVLTQLLTSEGELRSFVNIFLDEENIADLRGLDTPVPNGSVLSIILAVSGGMDSKAKDRRLSELRVQIPRVTPSEAQSLQQCGAVLLDIREQDEIVKGSPYGAIRIGRSFLELRIEDFVPNLSQQLLVICNGGTRSLFAAEDLRRLGYTDVRSVTGGFDQWKSENRPIELPYVLSQDARERYSRHLLMPEVGEAGQVKLLRSRVLIVGAGGLGSPAALYLAAAGVGTLGIIDNDRVDRSNLQRQVLHTDERVGTAKVDSARNTLLNLNPALKVEAYDERLTRENVEDLFARYQMVVDGSDNFATHYLVNDACVKLGLPNIHGSVFRFEGQISVFWPSYSKRPGPCYRCIYPAPAPPELSPSCIEAGVLGVLPGVIGLLQAVETIKLLLELGDPLIGRMLYFDALRSRLSEFKVRRNAACPICTEAAAGRRAGG